MNKIFIKLLLIPLCLIIIFTPLQVGAYEMTYDIENTATQSIDSFKSNQRKLWIDNIWWMRDFIISDLSVLRDRDDVLRRLLKNQEYIGNSIKPYYGDTAGNKLTAMLKDYVIITGQVIDATKRGNKADLEKSIKLWNDNADKIANYLNELNPNLDSSILKEMLEKQSEYLTEAITARIAANWKADVDVFDKAETHIIDFSDLLSNGIIKQFPEKFQQ